MQYNRCSHISSMRQDYRKKCNSLLSLFRALLREEVSSGRLDKAASKADVLAELCNRLNFDPDAASALHKQLYRQKLDSLLEKKSLTGDKRGQILASRLVDQKSANRPENSKPDKLSRNID